jgi:hypothetical protein
MVRIKGISFPVLTSKISRYLIVTLVIALTVLICKSLSDQQGYYIVSFILLFVVSIMAASPGIGPIFLASLKSETNKPGAQGLRFQYLNKFQI